MSVCGTCAGPLEAFLRDLGVDEITGYPFDEPCSEGRGVGERCVSKQRYGCAKDLVCLRWRAGMGRCAPPWQELPLRVFAATLFTTPSSLMNSEPCASGRDLGPQLPKRT